MFDAFSQADASTTRRYGGTGLGLAICRRLTEAMGGSIDVSSRPGQGSTFFFDVPVRTPDTPEPSPAPLDPGTLRGPRVLVVDDNDTNRLILDAQLRRWHMQPTTVSSGPQALVALHESAAAGRPFTLDPGRPPPSRGARPSLPHAGDNPFPSSPTRTGMRTWSRFRPGCSPAVRLRPGRTRQQEPQ